MGPELCGEDTGGHNGSAGGERDPAGGSAAAEKLAARKKAEEYMYGAIAAGSEDTTLTNCKFVGVAAIEAWLCANSAGQEHFGGAVGHTCSEYQAAQAAARATEAARNTQGSSKDCGRRDAGSR